MAVTDVFSNGASEQDQDTYSFDHGAIFVSSSSELTDTTFAILLMDRLGRIPTQVGSYLTRGIAVILLCIVALETNGNRWLKIVLAFVARMFLWRLPVRRRARRPNLHLV